MAAVSQCGPVAGARGCLIQPKASGTLKKSQEAGFGGRTFPRTTVAVFPEVRDGVWGSGQVGSWRFGKELGVRHSPTRHSVRLTGQLVPARASDAPNWAALRTTLAQLVHR